MIEKITNDLDRLKVDMFPLILPKWYYGVDLDAIYFPKIGQVIIFFSLSSDQDTWRIQPFDSTLNAIRELSKKIFKIEVVCYHQEMREFMITTSISFVNNYNTSDGNNRRSIRISKLTIEQQKNFGKHDLIDLKTNQLNGMYTTYKLYLEDLKKRNGFSGKRSSKSSEVFASNIVLYGPPGTGKTRGAIFVSNSLLKGSLGIVSAKKIQEESIKLEDCSTSDKNWYSVQFHPSYAYEDFFEGIRPVSIQNDGKNDVSYDVVPGVFKIVSQLARANFESEKFGIKIKVRMSSDTLKNILQEGQSHIVQYRFYERSGYFKYNDEIVFSTGSHSPSIDESNKLPLNDLIELVWYASSSTVEQFVLFIDELNRGNPSRIFGEALSLIETSKRIGGTEPTFLRLPYSHEQFALSPNLNILCAMNSSDKSLAHLDQAFKRRFKFIYFGPNFSLIKDINFRKLVLDDIVEQKYIDSLYYCFEAINYALNELEIPIDNHIGHSYCIEILQKLKFVISNKSAKVDKAFNVLLSRLWKNELHPLLRDLLGQHKVNEFVEHFFDYFSNHNLDLVGIGLAQNSKEKFKTFLRQADSEIVGDVFQEVA